IQGLTAQIKNLTKCVYRTGLEIEDLVFSVLACAEAVVTNRQKDLGVAVVNIGASTTSIVVFEEGDVLYTSVLPVGAGHITSDIAIGLRTSIEVAEEVKIKYATAMPADVPKKERIDLGEFGVDGEETVERRYIAEISEARAEEIFEKIDQELASIDRSGMLPAGVVLTGGGSKLTGMVDLAKKQLRLPASLGTPIGITSVVDYSDDPAFSTAIGLVMWGQGISSVRGGGGLGKLFGKIKGMDKIGSGIVKLFKSMKP
ncbi:MAG: cell division protein FtsA, partial [Candidatus Uhrbacteria bacterium]